MTPKVSKPGNAAIPRNGTRQPIYSTLAPCARPGAHGAAQEAGSSDRILANKVCMVNATGPCFVTRKPNFSIIMKACEDDTISDACAGQLNCNSVYASYGGAVSFSDLRLPVLELRIRPAARKTHDRA